MIQSMNSAFYTLGHIQGIVILWKVVGRLQALCWESYALSHLGKIHNFQKKILEKDLKDLEVVQTAERYFIKNCYKNTYNRIPMTISRGSPSKVGGH